MNKILEQIIQTIQYVDFNTEYTALGIDLDNVRDKKTGRVNVADEIQAEVAAKNIIINVGQRGYLVAKNNSQIMFYDGRLWSTLDVDDWEEFLLKSVTKMKKDVSLFSTVKFQKILRQTMLLQIDKFEISKIDKKQVKINCMNGTLVISCDDGSFKLMPHNHKDRFRYCLNFDFSQDAEIPMFKDYINRVLPEFESQLLLQEILGSIIAKDLKLEFFGVFLGEGSNGKSVLHSIIFALFGKENVSTLSWRQLFSETYLVDMDGKLLNYSSELDSDKVHGSIDLIKILASKEPIYVRRLYNQSYQMFDYGRLLINANRMPSLVEFSHAYLRRVQIVVFDQTIKIDEIDINLAEKIIETELPGILNWIILGSQRIIANRTFTQSPKSISELNRYIREQNPVSAYVEEFGYIPSIDGQKIKFQNMYNEFIRYCRDNNLKVVNSHEFGKILRKMGFEVKKGAQNQSFVFAAKVFCGEDG